jgi:hypothetical protein
VFFLTESSYFFTKGPPAKLQNRRTTFKMLSTQMYWDLLPRDPKKVFFSILVIIFASLRSQCKISKPLGEKYVSQNKNLTLKFLKNVSTFCCIYILLPVNCCQCIKIKFFQHFFNILFFLHFFNILTFLLAIYSTF